MIPYFVMLGIPGFVAFMGDRGRARSVFFLLAVLFWLMIGLRWKVGTDWNNYLVIYNWSRSASFWESLLSREPSFALLNWVVHGVGGGFILLNAVAATAFCWGFFYLAQRCREPFLAITVATPLVVIAGSMNLTRQAIALGIICYLYASWDKGGPLRRIAWIVFAATFHFSSIFVLTFVALSWQSRGWGKFVAAAFIGGGMFAITSFAPSAMEAYSHLYISGQMNAPGAIVHVIVLSTAALTYFAFHDRWREVYGENMLCSAMALVALCLIPAVYVSSVGAYRLSLYLWPMAMYIWSGVPGIMPTAGAQMMYRLIVVFASAILLLGWLTLANNSVDWVPYHSWITQPPNSDIWVPRKFN